MTDDHGTIRIPKPTFKRANSARKEADETWEEFVERAIHAGPVATMPKDEIHSIVREELAENEDRIREISRDVVVEMVVDEAQRR